MTKKEILLKQRNAENVPLTDYISTDGYVWKMVENAMEEYAQQQVKNCVNMSLLCEFADYILHNANWSESFADKPWHSETLERNISSRELAESFLNSR